MSGAPFPRARKVTAVARTCALCLLLCLFVLSIEAAYLQRDEEASQALGKAVSKLG